MEFPVPTSVSGALSGVMSDAFSIFSGAELCCAHRHMGDRPPELQVTEDIRLISDVFAADGNAVSTFGLSNMVWGFGQFLGMLPVIALNKPGFAQAVLSMQGTPSAHLLICSTHLIGTRTDQDETAGSGSLSLGHPSKWSKLAACTA